jgi:hypothetical protein
MPSPEGVQAPNEPGGIAWQIKRGSKAMAWGLLKGVQSYWQYFDEAATIVSNVTGWDRGGIFKTLVEMGEPPADWAPRTLAERIVAGVMQAGPEIGMITSMPGTAGQVMAGMGAVRGGAEGGLPGAFKGALHGRLLGEILHGAGYIAKPFHAPTVGAIFGVDALAHGGDVEEVAEAFTVGTTLGLMGGGRAYRDPTAGLRAPEIPAAERPDIISRASDSVTVEPRRASTTEGKGAQAPSPQTSAPTPPSGRLETRKREPSATVNVGSIKPEPAIETKLPRQPGPVKPERVPAEQPPGAPEIQIQRAEQIRPKVVKDLQEISSSFGGEVGARIKEMERVVEKIQQKQYKEPGFGPEHIGDYLGSRVVDDPFSYGDMVVEGLKKKGYQALEIDDMFAKPNPWGYRSKHVQMKAPSGEVFELQLHFKESIPAIDKAHLTYEKWRNIESKHGKIPEEMWGEFQADIEATRQMWAEVERQYLERTGRLEQTPQKVIKKPGTVQPAQAGAKASVMHSEGSDPVRYEVWDVADVIPSHDPARGFAKDPRYPKNVQERVYHTDKSEQVKVLSHANAFEPRFVVSDNPDAINGPPIVTEKGVVLGGNSRAMTIKEVYGRNAEAAENYKKTLRDRAEMFGLDPAQIDQAKNPILVRVVEGEVKDPARKARLYNQPFTQGLDVKAEGVSRARMVSGETMERLADALETNNTIREFLSKPASRDFIAGLMRDGVLEKSQLNRLLNKRTGLLSEDGKRLVEQTLRGKIVDDFDLLDALEATPSVLQKVDRILPAMSRLKARGDAWDISEDLKAALGEYVDYKASKASSLEQYTAQKPLFGGESKPEVQALLKSLDKDGQLQIAKRFNDFARAASLDVPGQAVLPGMKAETSREAFDRIFEVDRVRSEGGAREFKGIEAAERYAKQVGTSPETVLREPAPAQLSFDFSKKAEPPKPVGGKKPSQRVRMVTTGNIKASNNYVKGPADAAALLSHIRKSAQENAYMITTDADGRVLEIHRYGKGVRTANAISPLELAGHAMNVKGAKQVWFLHNHPGGKTKPSAQDLNVHAELKKMLRLNDIEVGSLVVAGTKFRNFNESGPQGIEAQIRPTLRTGVSLPVKERELVREPGHLEQPSLSAPQDAINVIREQYNNQEGFLLLDSQNRPVAFYEYRKGLTAKRAARNLVKLAENTNASGMIFNSTKDLYAGPSSRRKFLRSVNRALGKDLQILDVLDQGRSMQERGGMAAIFNQKMGEGYDYLYSAEELAMADTRQGDLFTGMPGKKAAKSKEQQTLDQMADTLQKDATFKKKGQMELFAEDFSPFEMEPVPARAVNLAPPPEGLRRSKMIARAEKVLKLPLRTGKIRGKKLGVYKPKPKVARIKKANDVEAALHEVGHHVRRLLGIREKMPPEVQRLAYEGAKDVHEEGFAEFFRLFVTQESKAKKEAPEFYREFSDHLAKYKDVENLVIETRQSWNEWVAMPSVQKVMSIIRPGRVKKTLPTVNEIYTSVKDALYPIKLARDLAADRGHTFNPSEDPYILARVTRGWPRMAEQFLRWGTFQLKKSGPRAVEFTGPAYLDIIKPIEKAGQRHLFDAYLVARRASSDPRILKGFERVLSEKDFNQTIRELDPMFKKTAEKLDAYQSELVDFLADSGRISTDLAQRIRAENPFYAPFYRVMDGEAPVGGLSSKKFSQVMSPIKRLKGSSREIISPTESVLYNTYAIMNSATRNRVGNALMRMAEMEGMGDVIEKVPVKLKPQKVTLQEAVRSIKKSLASAETDKATDFEAVLSEMMGHQRDVKKVLREIRKTEKGEDLELAKIESIIEKAGMTPEDLFLVNETITTFRPDYTPRANEAIFYRNGKPEVYELSPELAKAVANVDASSINAIVKILSLPAKTLRAGATVFSPEFGIRNPVRDQLVAFIQSKYGYKPGLDLFRGIFHMAKKTELWQNYNASGAANANIVSVDRDYLSKNLRGLISKSEVKHMVKHPLEIIQRISEYGEEATRMGEFARAFKANGGDLNALYDAAIRGKEVSVDFSRLGGPGARALNLITAFWNARLEGLDQMRKTFQEQPAQASLKAFMAVTLPSVLLWYQQRDDPYYQELPAWRRALMWNFVFHKEDGSLDWVLSIPKPFEYGQIFGTLPEMALESMYEQDPEALVDALKQLGKSLEMVPLPTGLIPLGEWWANESWFFDRPIVGRSKEGLDPYLQFGRWTSETVKLVAEMMDKVPGLRKVASPQKIENLIHGYTAAAGRLALESSDQMLDWLGVTDAPPDPSMTLADIPGIRALAARFPSANANSIEKFYKMYESEMQAWESTKQRAGVRGYGLEVDRPARLQTLSTAASALSTLRKMVDLTHKNKSMEAEEKREALDSLYFAMINIARAQLQKKPLRQEAGE